MQAIKRLTTPTVEVMQALLDTTEPTWGLRVAKQVNRAPGTIYPILNRLEKLGWIAGRWEEPVSPGRPRRRTYALTETGTVEAKHMAAEFERRQRHASPLPRSSREVTA